MLEIVVDGTPRSLQGSGPGKNEWKGVVGQAAREGIGTDERIDYDDVWIRILHFCRVWGDLSGDLDNIAKPIIDALLLIAIFNDNQVKRLSLRRTETDRHGITLIEGATPLLARRLESLLARDDDPGFVYISVERWNQHGSL